MPSLLRRQKTFLPPYDINAMILRCIVADDEPLAKLLIEKYIKQTPGLELAGSYTSAIEANDAIARREAEVAFIDIHMPGMSGLQLARTAEKAGVRVVFTTAYPDYALDGFRLNALDYLLKPVSYREFSEAANRAVAAWANIPDNTIPDIDTISVRSNYRTQVIQISDIIYIEGLRDYVKIHLKNSDLPVLTQMSMKKIESVLMPPKFVRIHRSYIVSTSYIKEYSRTKASVDAGGEASPVDLPVGAKYRDRFLNQMNSIRS